jgi:hypothetical protein
MRFERQRNFTFGALVLVVLPALAACGGRSDNHLPGTTSDDDEAGTAGTGGTGVVGTGGSATAGDTGTGGSVAGGTGGTPNGGVGGASAGTGGSPEGGHSGTSAGRGSGGTSAAGRGGAAAGGMSGAGGAAGAAGAVCMSINQDYASAQEQAQSCDPNAADDQCTQKVAVGTVCGCYSFANPANADAIARMAEDQRAFNDNQCVGGVTCGACLEPVRGRCSADGHCEDVPPGSGRSCKVAGKIYADGETGIPDPVSCNTCSCYDGQLACTEIGGCEKDCPDGKVFGTDCASCGPVDDCLMPEYDCFQRCVDGCTAPNAFCIGGLCLNNVCG